MNDWLNGVPSDSEDESPSVSVKPEQSVEKAFDDLFTG